MIPNFSPSQLYSMRARTTHDAAPFIRYFRCNRALPVIVFNAIFIEEKKGQDNDEARMTK
jgi:hypothetical protein